MGLFVCGVVNLDYSLGICGDVRIWDFVSLVLDVFGDLIAF